MTRSEDDIPIVKRHSKARKDPAPPVPDVRPSDSEPTMRRTRTTARKVPASSVAKASQAKTAKGTSKAKSTQAASAKVTSKRKKSNLGTSRLLTPPAPPASAPSSSQAPAPKSLERHAVESMWNLWKHTAVQVNEGRKDVRELCEHLGLRCTRPIPDLPSFDDPFAAFDQAQKAYEAAQFSMEDEEETTPVASDDEETLPVLSPCSRRPVKQTIPPSFRRAFSPGSESDDA